MGFILPSFKHIINPRLKYIYLSFDSEVNLVIKTPRISQGDLEKLLIKKSSWIEKSRQKILAKKGGLSPSDGKLEVYFGGIAFGVEVVSGEYPHPSLEFDGSKFTYYAMSFNSEEFAVAVDRLYLGQAKVALEGLVAKWSQKSSLLPKKISFRKASKRWGSCNSRDEISLNYRLMKLPQELQEYVVVHELAHIRHKNHKKEFWDFVRQLMPDYKKHDTHLKTFRP